MKILCTLFLALLPLSVQAGVYKCDVGSKLVYQQTPCAEKGQETDISTHGNDIMSRQEALQERTRRTESLNRATQTYRNSRIPEPRRQVTAEPSQELSLTDKFTVEKLNRKIKHRMESDVFVSQNRADGRALMRQVCAIYDEYPALPCPYEKALNPPTEQQPSSATVTTPRNPIPMSDGRMLFSNGPGSNSFTDSNGHHWIQQGNQAFNPQTGEYAILH